MVIVKAKTISLAVLLCFYTIFVFSINPSIDEFAGMSLEVTDQNDEGVFSSLSRNFEQTIEEINTGDEKGDSSSSSEKESTSSTSTDSTSNVGERGTTSDIPITTSDPSNPISNNSTTNDDLENNNQTNFNN